MIHYRYTSFAHACHHSQLHTGPAGTVATLRVWHMPHCIFLLATPRNGNIYCLLSEQPSSHDFHATSCALLPFSNFCASTKSTRCISPSGKISLSSLGKPPENSGICFYARIRLLARNNINTSSSFHQRCQHLIQGALLLTKTRRDYCLSWLFFLSPFMMHFSRLMHYHQVT